MFDERGLLPPPQGAELTAAGEEFRPQALAATIRWAHRTFRQPIYVTESGIATDDDRIAFIDQALKGVRACLGEGIAVHSYMYWSLLVGDRVDADMAKESANLNALQTKQQLGIQGLSIANSSSFNLLSLFRRLDLPR